MPPAAFELAERRIIDDAGRDLSQAERVRVLESPLSARLGAHWKRREFEPSQLHPKLILASVMSPVKQKADRHREGDGKDSGSASAGRVRGEPYPLQGFGCLGNIVTGCFLHGQVSVDGWSLGDPMERARSGLNPQASPPARRQVRTRHKLNGKLDKLNRHWRGSFEA